MTGPSDHFLTEADTVIIGSGICGALIAQNLLGRDHGKEKKHLVMLEARTVASGATGRNGMYIRYENVDCADNTKAAISSRTATGAF